jgi:hypothetical protein
MTPLCIMESSKIYFGKHRHCRYISKTVAKLFKVAIEGERSLIHQQNFYAPLWIWPRHVELITSVFPPFFTLCVYLRFLEAHFKETIQDDFYWTFKQLLWTYGDVLVTVWKCLDIFRKIYMLLNFMYFPSMFNIKIGIAWIFTSYLLCVYLLSHL